MIAVQGNNKVIALQAAEKSQIRTCVRILRMMCSGDLYASVASIAPGLSQILPTTRGTPPATRATYRGTTPEGLDSPHIVQEQMLQNRERGEDGDWSVFARYCFNQRAEGAFCPHTCGRVRCRMPQDAAQIKQVPPPTTSAASGREMFKAYCAACHGTDGRGHGPAAPALKSSPADLTALAKNNGGRFPADRVMSILSGQATVTAHGNRDMPVWGPILWRMSQGHEGEVQQRITNLTRYIETLQRK